VGRQGGAGGRRESIAEARERRRTVEDPDVVLGAAARLLETRARSVEEVRRRLTAAGYRPDLVAGVINRLVELGILDDAAFAQAWVDSRDRSRPRGAHALRQELQQKGIDRSLVDELLADREASANDRADEVAAGRLLARHAPALNRVADPRLRRQRAYGVLARNGFAPDICSTAVREFLREVGPDD
jgi:regulatory protein